MPNEPGIDLAKLEYEFATDPNSEAFIPLAEAYLGMGRFVEAMVVCKKGIKAHPDLPTGRLIMARIYCDQAKHQKAIDEVNKLLKMSPENPDAFRLLGIIYLKLGKEEDGIKSLKMALDLKPDDKEARESLLKIGIDYIPSAAPVQTAPPAQAPLSERPTEQGMPVLDPSRPSSQPPISGVPTQRAMPAVARQAPVSTPPKKRIADIYHEMEAAHAKPKVGKSFKYSLYMGGALVVILIIYVIYTWQAGLRMKEINDHLENGRNLFKQDSFTGYKKALEHYQAIYKLDDGHPEALSRGAFIAAVLVGEYGEQDTLNDKGKTTKLIDMSGRYIAKAMSLKLDSSMLLAAQGMMAMYGGGSMNDAVKVLEKGLKNHPDSAVIHTALGQILLKKGELGEAKDHLLKGAAQSEMRAFVSLGQYAMRRSMYREANQAFNKALQSDRNHTKSVLLKGLLGLIWGDSIHHTMEVQKILERYKAELDKDASEREKAFAKFIGAILMSRSSKKRESNAGFAEMRNLLKKSSSNSLFQFAAAREMRRAGQLKQAKETIKMALRLDSTRPDFVLEEASVFLTLRDFEAARSRAMRVQEMDTESGQSLLIVAEAYLGEKNFAKAKGNFKQAAGFADVEGKARMRLGDVFMTQPRPDPDRAQAQYELAVQALIAAGENRLAAETCFKLAKIYASKNRVKEFNAILIKAIKLDPTFGPPYCFLAVNLNMDDKDSREQAVDFCKKCIHFASGEQTMRCREIVKRFK